MWDVAFPGTVMVLKLFFKICVEQQVKYVDVAKALLAFPVDIAFLSLSFGSAVLYAREPAGFQPETVRSMFTILLIALVLIFVVTVVTKKSDRAFTSDSYILTFVLFAAAYSLSALTFWGALNLGRFL